MHNLSLTRAGMALIAVIGVVAVALVLAVSPARGQGDITYNVTIENLTTGQPFTPPVVAAHSDQVDVFELGQAASPELQAIAENGNNDPLVALLGGSAAVFDMATGTGPVLPGESATITVKAPEGSLLSVAAMLICTNDGFTGVDSWALPASGSASVDADAYDAGTETNTEDFADIVPPCQGLIGVSSDDDGTGVTNPALAEGGVIAAHSGIQGGTDLTVADHGWTDPVARITVNVMPSQEPDLEAIYRQWIDAFNAGDVAGALELLTDDAVREPAGPCALNPCVGKEAIKGVFEHLVAENPSFTITSIEVSDNILTARLEVISPIILSAGVERIIRLDTVEFTGDKMSSISSFPDLTDEQTVVFQKSQMPPGQLPPTGGPPSAGDGGFAWSYILIAAGVLAVLGGGALITRRHRA